MFGRTKKVAKEIAAQDMLFGDLSLEYWAGVANTEMPWRLFKKAKQYLDYGEKSKAIEVLKEITTLPALESRQYLQAYHFLASLDVMPHAEMKIFGVVVEVGMPEGVDLLAIYSDHSARYYNYSGRAIVWETADKSLDEKIDAILFQSISVVQQIGPWKEKRRPAPVDKMARINFLTSHGLHFGEAPQAVLFNDPLVLKLMYAIMDVRDALIQKTSVGNN